MNHFAIIPTPLEQIQASSGLALLKGLSSGAELVLNSKSIVFEADGAVVQVIKEVLELFAAGEAVMLQPISPEMSTQEAADFLGCSRPHVVKLLERGKIPFHKVGTHRRVLRKDVLLYDQNLTQLREKALVELSAEAQRLGLGY
jgi:excisionase family DNA binding protein